MPHVHNCPLPSAWVNTSCSRNRPNRWVCFGGYKQINREAKKWLDVMCVDLNPALTAAITQQKVTFLHNVLGSPRDGHNAFNSEMLAGLDCD